MLISQLKIGDSATITKINADKVLKDRFISLGIFTGEEITLKQLSLAKQTIEIAIDNSLIVLRRDEAKKIEIKRSKKDV